MHNATEIYCSHFSEGASKLNSFYNEPSNTLQSTTRFELKSLQQYLECDQCKVLTPMINENPGRLDFFILRARICYYFVLSKFATLLSMPIKSDIDPLKHPYLVKFARICALQNRYYRSLQVELCTYKHFWEPLFSKKTEERDQKQVIEMKMWLIPVYYNRELLQRYTYAKPEEVAHKYYDTFFQHKTSVSHYCDKIRLENLRTRQPKEMGFRSFEFKRLFEMGLLVKPPIKEIQNEAQS